MSPSSAFELTSPFIAEALGLTSPSKQHYTAVVTDSRKVHPGCLFLAIQGEVFDGHTFIDEAIEQGARGIVFKRGKTFQSSEKVDLFAVDDTVDAYRKIAHSWRLQFSIPLIAIAGSVGKTSTKEILTAILRGKYAKVLKTLGSQNGFLGIPMTLMDLNREHQAAVIEVGIDEIGAMKQHMELVKATASVLTTIGAEHLEKLKDIPTVAKEEAIALTHVAQSGGLVAISLDDPWVKPFAKTIHDGKKTTYSLEDEAANILGAYDQTHDTLKISGDVYPLPLPGLHNARNLLAAISLALGIGLAPSEIQAGLKTFQPVSGRSEVKEIGTATRYRVICDYYNANPDSTTAGLILLTKLAQGGKRFACLADMLELGSEEEKFHRDLATVLIKEGTEHVFLFGERMKALQDELKKRGFSQEVKHFPDQASLARAVSEKVRAHDTVLIKGSHSMKMENVFAALKQSTQ